MNKIIKINSFRTKLFFGRKINLRYRSMTLRRLQNKFSRYGSAKIVKVGEPGFLGDEPLVITAECVYRKHTHSRGGSNVGPFGTSPSGALAGRIVGRFAKPLACGRVRW